MSTLRAIVEMQGSLDTAVVATQDPRVMEIADAFFPGTSANADWFREIMAFFFPNGVDGESEPPTSADPIRALDEIESDWFNEGRRPTPAEASRFIYGLGAVTHAVKRLPDDVALPFGDPFVEQRRPTLANVFALTSGREPGSDDGFFSTDQFNAVEDLFVNGFNGWEDWQPVAQQLAFLQVLTLDAASVPLCNAAVINYRGTEAVVVDAELKSDQVSLDDLKAVVDPRNWHDDSPNFFCSMVYKGLRPDGWRRVLETVGFCGYSPLISPRLRTMLKFHKADVNALGRYEALLDYDLNDPVPDPEGDGKITIDNGYINMWTEQNGNPTQPPVFVHVRKVCRINGLRPYTQKRFVCMMGYAFTVEDMLFGSAKHRDPTVNYAPWDDPANEQPGDGGQQQGGQAGKKAPPDNSVASTAISMAAQCVQDLAAKQYDLADKWMAGQLTVADLAQYSAEVGARIASDPWKFIQAIGQQKGGGT